ALQRFLEVGLSWAIPYGLLAGLLIPLFTSLTAKAINKDASTTVVIYSSLITVLYAGLLWLSQAATLTILSGVVLGLVLGADSLLAANWRSNLAGKKTLKSVLLIASVLASSLAIGWHVYIAAGAAFSLKIMPALVELKSAITIAQVKQILQQKVVAWSMAVVGIASAGFSFYKQRTTKVKWLSLFWALETAAIIAISVNKAAGLSLAIPYALAAGLVMVSGFVVVAAHSHLKALTVGASTTISLALYTGIVWAQFGFNPYLIISGFIASILLGIDLAVINSGNTSLWQKVKRHPWLSAVLALATIASLAVHFGALSLEIVALMPKPVVPAVQPVAQPVVRPAARQVVAPAASKFTPELIGKTVAWAFGGLGAILGLRKIFGLLRQDDDRHQRYAAVFFILAAAEIITIAYLAAPKLGIELSWLLPITLFATGLLIHILEQGRVIFKSPFSLSRRWQKEPMRVLFWAIAILWAGYTGVSVLWDTSLLLGAISEFQAGQLTYNSLSMMEGGYTIILISDIIMVFIMFFELLTMEILRALGKIKVNGHVNLRDKKRVALYATILVLRISMLLFIKVGIVLDLLPQVLRIGEWIGSIALAIIGSLVVLNSFYSYTKEHKYKGALVSFAGLMTLIAVVASSAIAVITVFKLATEAKALTILLTLGAAGLLISSIIGISGFIANKIFKKPVSDSASESPAVESDDQESEFEDDQENSSSSLAEEGLNSVASQQEQASSAARVQEAAKPASFEITSQSSRGPPTLSRITRILVIAIFILSTPLAIGLGYGNTIKEFTHLSLPIIAFGPLAIVIALAVFIYGSRFLSRHPVIRVLLGLLIFVGVPSVLITASYMIIEADRSGIEAELVNRKEAAIQLAAQEHGLSPAQLIELRALAEKEINTHISYADWFKLMENSDYIIFGTIAGIIVLSLIIGGLMTFKPSKNKNKQLVAGKRGSSSVASQQEKGASSATNVQEKETAPKTSFSVGQITIIAIGSLLNYISVPNLLFGIILTSIGLAGISVKILDNASKIVAFFGGVTALGVAVILTSVLITFLGIVLIRHVTGPRVSVTRIIVTAFIASIAASIAGAISSIVLFIGPFIILVVTIGLMTNSFIESAVAKTPEVAGGAVPTTASPN
ncbi:MAG: hypothetical protein KJ977_04680, partial [Candidatus Omnitrophica bacterium]|nr:hypothetical protein [Candidatus Omnitrophota bacterium]